MADFTSLLGAAASATPWGAAAGAAADVVKGFTDSGPSSARGAPGTIGPVNINVSGFGSKSSGSASQTLDQKQNDGGDFPAATLGNVGSSMPGWFLPALGVLLVVAIGAHAFKRRG